MIYCIGDSYMAGDELVDYLHVPNYPKLMSLDSSDFEVKHFRKWYEKNVLSLPMEQRANIKIQAKEFAYPNLISKKLNVEVINAAEPGASMEFIATKLIDDIIKLKASGKTVKLVIAQLTGHSRVYAALNGILGSYLLGFENYHPDVIEMLKPRVIHETNYSLYRAWLFNVIRIYDFCRANNINLIIDRNNETKKLHEYAKRFTDLVELENYINVKLFNLFDEVRKLDNKWVSTICPNGHYSQPVHDAMANTLADYINECNLLV